jgi:hypothetical protein
MARRSASSRRSLMGLAKQVQRDLTPVISRGIRDAAVEIVNGLVDAGPGWSGEFSRSWYVVAPGETPPSGGRGGDGIYEYTYRNFQLRKFERALDRGGRSIKFEIVNTAPHADIAIDKEEATFYQIGQPLKPQIEGGPRPGDENGQLEHLRYQIAYLGYGEEASSSITAPQDWFETYVQSVMQGDLARGFRFSQSDRVRF